MNNLIFRSKNIIVIAWCSTPKTHWTNYVWRSTSPRPTVPCPPAIRRSNSPRVIRRRTSPRVMRRRTSPRAMRRSNSPRIIRRRTSPRATRRTLLLLLREEVLFTVEGNETLSATLRGGLLSAGNTVDGNETLSATLRGGLLSAGNT
ncbi:hypothetical protein TNIN_179331 [Trichonephila inaurata madagascariensis]|uniref:Uncharacterized protein n=1 Tax=Trichonephila inaurata madagascariensis TaxID=2747483 RepID=A0A8X7CCY0_9ARAC|nr:hypothetical protein TNIN_179331 [Trichonephila inaurata madagascariensis]